MQTDTWIGRSTYRDDEAAELLGHDRGVRGLGRGQEVHVNAARLVDALERVRGDVQVDAPAQRLAVQRLVAHVGLPFSLRPVSQAGIE